MKHYRRRSQVNHTIVPKGKNMGHEFVIEMQGKKLRQLQTDNDKVSNFLQVPEGF